MRVSGSGWSVLLWLLAVPAAVSGDFVYDDYTTLEPGRTDHRQPQPSPWSTAFNSAVHWVARRMGIHLPSPPEHPAPEGTQRRSAGSAGWNQPPYPAHDTDFIQKGSSSSQIDSRSGYPYQLVYAHQHYYPDTAAHAEYPSPSERNQYSGFAAHAEHTIERHPEQYIAVSGLGDPMEHSWYQNGDPSSEPHVLLEQYFTSDQYQQALADTPDAEEAERLEEEPWLAPFVPEGTAYVGFQIVLPVTVTLPVANDSADDTSTSGARR